MNCEHNAPKEYCPICSTYAGREELLTADIDCPNCAGGIEVVLDHYGDENGYREQECKLCNGTGFLTGTRAENLHRMRISYWYKKVLEDK